MKTLVLLVHGFNVHDWRLSVGKLRSFFMQYGDTVVMPISYGWTGLIGLERLNNKVAKKLAKLSSNANTFGFDRVIAVGHSNGCAILYMASKQYGATVDKMVFINPALKKDRLPRCPVDVWYSPSDKPAKWAKYAPNFLVKQWGEMGRTGPAYITGAGVRAFNKEKRFPVCSSEHSDVFEDEKLAFFGGLIARKAME